MGLWDAFMSFFGVGACKMELTLDANQVAVGGILSGRAKLIGASKPHPVTSVSVRLIYVAVTTNEDSAIPDIDTRVLVDNVIINNDRIGENSEKEYDFTLQIPGGTEPTAHNVSYQVLVTADIPSLKDPTAKVDLKVVEAEEGKGIDLAEINRRWPALSGDVNGEIVEALNNIRWDHSDYDEESNLRNAEPVVAKFLRHDVDDVRTAALEAWGALIAEIATKQHLSTLKEAIEANKDDESFLVAAIEVAGKLHKVGGLDVINSFSTHESAVVREQVAEIIGRNSIGKGIKTIEAMLDAEEDDAITARYLSALANFSSNIEVIKRFVALAKDPSTPLVIRKIIPTSLRFSYKFREVAFEGLQALLNDESTEVRNELANAAGNFIEQPGGLEFIKSLLADSSDEVRATMAYEITNIDEDKVRPLGEILEKLIESDPAPSVRQSAMSSWCNGRPVAEVVTFYRGWMQKDPCEEILRGVVHGIKFEDDAPYKEMLKEIAQCEFPQVANEAQGAI